MTLDVGALCGNRTHTLALEGRCSTVKLIARLERAAGVEPTPAAWKVAVLPLYNARMIPDGMDGGALLEGGAPHGRSVGVELLEGVEPPTR